MPDAAIPQLRLSDYTQGSAGDRERFRDALRAGLQDFGFVDLCDHGVDAALIRDAYAAFARLFALDDEAKRRLSGTAGGARGLTAFGVEHAKDHAYPDLKEFFHVGRDVPDGHPMAGVYPPNVWPTGLPELRPVCQALLEALEACAIELLRALAESFGLPSEAFAEMLRDGNHVLRALHYPPVPGTAHPQSIRAAAHEDINLITLLCEATDSGLEILRPDGSWMVVETLPGHIVADAGDMLARTTNGAIPATTHRVTNAPGEARRHRYSLPFFAHPRPECDLSVRPEFITPERPPRTPPITAGEFLDERLREIGLLQPT